MPPPPYVQLAQLENKKILGKVSEEDYISAKWSILQEVFESGELINPIFKDKRRRELRDSRKIPFCYVAPSPFIYGPDNGYGLVKAGMYFSKFPVRVKEFIEFLEDSGWDYPDEDLERMWAVSPEMECPVSNVSWLDAKEYCRWLRRVTDEYYSLPNEEEWEYAARGIDGRYYPWGYNEPCNEIACFQGARSFETTVPVISYMENKSPFGCIGMVGNVWEWCLDAFDDPDDPHVLRGGSWADDIDSVSCVGRNFSYPPEKRLETAGIRVVYLPGEMLEEYQRKLMGLEESDEDEPETIAAPAKPQLKVLKKLPDPEKKKKPKPAASLKKVGKALPMPPDAGS